MMRRLLPLLAAALGMAALMSGCGTTGAPTSAGTAGTASPVVVRVTISGDQVSPNGDTVAVPLGSPVELEIHADADGEIHVHSTPEQHVAYHAGTTQASLGTFTVPGQVEVESHALDKTIVILQIQ